MSEVRFEQEKYSPELVSAVERSLAAHNLRLRAGLDITDVLNTLEANQCTVETIGGNLAVSQNGSPMHAAQAMESLAKQRGELFYARDTEAGSITCKDDCDRAAKIAYLKANGLDAWARLPQHKPADADVVVLSPSKLTRAQYQALPREQKIQFIQKFGEKGVSAVMQRTGKK